jgi:hypothetical protein
MAYYEFAVVACRCGHYGASGTQYSSAGAERGAAELCGAVLKGQCRCDRLRVVQGISLRGSE